MMHVKMSVYCGSGGYGCGSLIGEYYDHIDEKYPFYCEECEETTSGKWPWSIRAEAVDEAPVV